jgi:transposase-like protein
MNALAEVPETEVVAKSQRRRFSAEYKRKVLQEVAACKRPGELGAVLRREGLYSSHLTKWREQEKRGDLAPKKRGPKARVVDERDRRIAELEREKARLEAELEKSKVIIDVQKKVSLLLGVETPDIPPWLRVK